MGKMKEVIMDVKELLDLGLTAEEISKRLNMSLETVTEVIAWLESDDMK